MEFISANQFLKLVSFKEVIEAVEKALILLEEGKVNMPNRMHINQGKNTVLLMPCFTEKVFGTKLVSVFPDNQEVGLPSILGIMVLNDGKTGQPLAIMDAPMLTALRTAGLGALGIKNLSSPTASTLGIVGAGVQGLYQTLMTCAIRNITDVFIYNRTPEKLITYKEQVLIHYPNLNIHFCENTTKVLEHSEIVITCTSSETPVLPNTLTLLKGKCIVGIGSYKPNMREFPTALYGLVDKIFIDNDYASQESGDVGIPLAEGWLQEKQVFRLGTLLKNKSLFSTSETTVFKSVGMAVLDVVVGELVFRKSKV